MPRKIEGPTKDVLHRLYVEEQKSTSQIAATLGVNASTARAFLKRAGIPLRTNADGMRLCIQQGRRPTARLMRENNSRWKGGRRLSSGGYVEIMRRDHPRARANGYVFEHLVVWEEHNGSLPPGWHVHHVNGNKQDNSIGNLQGMPSQEHVHYIASQKAAIMELQGEIAWLKARVATLEGMLEVGDRVGG